MLTTVASSTTISWAAASTARTHQRRAWRLSASAGESVPGSEVTGRPFVSEVRDCVYASRNAVGHCATGGPRQAGSLTVRERVSDAPPLAGVSVTVTVTSRWCDAACRPVAVGAIVSATVAPALVDA